MSLFGKMSNTVKKGTKKSLTALSKNKIANTAVHVALNTAGNVIAPGVGTAASMALSAGQTANDGGGLKDIGVDVAGSAVGAVTGGVGKAAVSAGTEVAKEAGKEALKEGAKEVAKETAKDVAKTTVKDVAKDTVKKTVSGAAVDLVADEAKVTDIDVSKLSSPEATPEMNGASMTGNQGNIPLANGEVKPEDNPYKPNGSTIDTKTGVTAPVRGENAEQGLVDMPGHERVDIKNQKNLLAGIFGQKGDGTSPSKSMNFFNKAGTVANMGLAFKGILDADKMKANTVNPQEVDPTLVENSSGATTANMKSDLDRKVASAVRRNEAMGKEELNTSVLAESIQGGQQIAATEEQITNKNNEVNAGIKNNAASANASSKSQTSLFNAQAKMQTNQLASGVKSQNLMTILQSPINYTESKVKSDTSLALNKQNLMEKMKGLKATDPMFKKYSAELNKMA